MRVELLHAEKRSQTSGRDGALFYRPVACIEQLPRFVVGSKSVFIVVQCERRSIALKTQCRNTKNSSFMMTCWLCEPSLSVLESAAGAQAEQALAEKENGG